MPAASCPRARTPAAGLVPLLLALAALVLGPLVLGGCMANAGRQPGHVPRAPSTGPGSPTVSVAASPTAAETGGDDPGTELGPQPAPATALPFDDVRRPVAWLPALTMRTGQIRMLEGRFTVRSAVLALQATQIRCTDGVTTYHSTYTTRNTSKDPEEPSTVGVRWLFTAPADDTYRCGLFGHADKQGRPAYELRVQGPPATRIVAREQPLRGALQWPVAHDVEVRPKAHTELFRRGIEVVPGSDRMRLDTAVEVTDHYEGRVYDYDAVVKLALRVDQLDESGRSCGQSWTAVARQRITREEHHEKVSVVLGHVPVELARDCSRQFAVRAILHDVSGSSVTVHGPAYSDATVEMF